MSAASIQAIFRHRSRSPKQGAVRKNLGGANLQPFVTEPANAKFTTYVNNRDFSTDEFQPEALVTFKLPATFLLATSSRTTSPSCMLRPFSTTTPTTSPRSSTTVPITRALNQKR